MDPESETSLRGISTYSWCAGLGALGFLETGYLTYLKLTNTEVFCPIGGGSCSDVLNSDYSVVFGRILILGLVFLLFLLGVRRFGYWFLRIGCFLSMFLLSLDELVLLDWRGFSSMNLKLHWLLLFIVYED